jgi:hypothetical protein
MELKTQATKGRYPWAGLALKVDVLLQSAQYRSSLSFPFASKMANDSME